MAVTEILGGLKDKATQAVADANTELDTLRNLETEIGDEKQAAHDAGFQEGLSQASAPGDKVYSQADMDAVVNPLNDQIVGLKNQLVDSETALTGLQGQLDPLMAQVAQDKVDLQKAHDDGVAALADMQGKLDAMSAAKAADDSIIAGLQGSVVQIQGLVDQLKAILVPAAPAPVDPAPVDPAPQA
jgi:phosphoglycerate-specific signal transduction histidine kinase